MIARVFDRKGSPLLATVFIVLFVLESKRHLRKRRQLRSERTMTNAMVGIPSFTLLRLVFLPVVVGLAAKNIKWQIGITGWSRMPRVLMGILAFLVMDYTNYLWHILNHKIPLLWRFHVVHHSDRDLDVTTALRFHFGELIGSVFYRGAFVLLSGATPLQVLVYEIFFEGATQFHHSNVRLSKDFEAVLNKIIVTPRMHGIHHSEIKEEADSNYSVIFSFWDRLHKTIRLNIPQNELTIGVPAYSHSSDLTPRNLLKLPFTTMRPWDEALLHRR